MLSEKENYKLLWDVINELSFLNTKGMKSLTLFEEKLESKEFGNLKQSYKIEKCYYRFYSLCIAVLILSFGSKFPFLNRDKYNTYETTTSTYVNGELVSEPLAEYISDLEREKIVYLDQVYETNDNISVYRYDVTNKSVNSIKDYNVFNLTESSREFVGKITTNVKYSFDNTVTVITQNKNKSMFDKEKYDTEMFEFKRFFPLLTCLMLLAHSSSLIRYNDKKDAYMNEVDALCKKYILPYLNYKEYYKYIYEDLKKDMKKCDKLDLVDVSFSSFYNKANEIEEACEKFKRLLRK